MHHSQKLGHLQSYGSSGHMFCCKLAAPQLQQLLGHLQVGYNSLFYLGSRNTSFRLLCCAAVAHT